jgi:hypothetical protein
MVREEKREEAAFEAGIKLGALLHQFTGAPVSFENAKILETAMESCMRLQPFVVDAEVKINREKLRDAISGFGYTTLSGDLIRARVKVKVGDAEVSAVIEWDEAKRYPLMRLL